MKRVEMKNKTPSLSNRLLLLICISFVMSVTAALAQKHPGVPAELVPLSSHAQDPIQVIRARYATINKRAAGYKTVKKELSGFSLEGGQMVAHMDGTKIMKIVASHFGEGGKAVEEYYYWDDQLIFVLRVDSRYDKPGSGKVVRKEENRFYFNEGRLIRWVGHKAKQVKSSNSEYPEQEKQYIQLSKELVEGARAAKPTIESSTP